MNRSGGIDPFKILRIHAGATLAEVKAAYLDRIKQCHPDIGGSEEEAKQVNFAYNFLKTHPEYCGLINKPQEPVNSRRYEQEVEEDWMKTVRDDYEASRANSTKHYSSRRSTTDEKREQRESAKTQQSRAAKTGGTDSSKKSQTEHSSSKTNEQSKANLRINSIINKYLNYYEIHVACEFLGKNVYPVFKKRTIKFLVSILLLMLILNKCPKEYSIQSNQAEQIKEQRTTGPSINQDQLIADLQAADEARRPIAITQNDGSIRYEYYKNDNEPTPSIEDLENQIKNPINYQQFYFEIRTILNELERAGVYSVLEIPGNLSVGGTWSPREKLVRINPDIIQKGSNIFHETLAHEAIHVAQSCRTGSTTSIPSRIGLVIKYSISIDNSVYHPIYSSNQEEARLIEREAYSNSKEIGIASKLLKQYCKQ